MLCSIISAILVGHSLLDLDQPNQIAHQKYACRCHPSEFNLDERRRKFKILKRNALIPTPVRPPQEFSYMPPSFSWGDPYSDENFVNSAPSQGGCGSCYLHSTAFAFKERISILLKHLGIDSTTFDRKRFDLDYSLRCSPYNQGCYGGYNILAALQLYAIGIPLEGTCPSSERSKKCQFVTNPLDDVNQIYLDSNSSKSKCKENSKWYARRFGYVGGCYECNKCKGDILMMKEILENGPISVGLEFPTVKYTESPSNPVKGKTEAHHSRYCDIRQESNQWLTGWELTTHAVAIVGWSEDIVNGEKVKYWICRNSWGINWGKKGYFKLRRGINLYGVESEAVFVDPDITRGMLKRVIDNKSAAMI